MTSKDGKPKSLPAHLRPLFEGKLTERASRALEGVLEGQAERLSTGRMGRALAMGKFAVGGGGRFLLGKAIDAIGGASAEQKSELSIDLAADMLKTFSEMRGIAMKIGQMLSYLDDAMPPEARKVLAVLQRDVSPMPWEVAREQIIAELGKPPEEVFSEIEQRPLAAASIGQVHRATLRDGTRVAVKIQYPGIEAAMAADLKNARFMSMFKKLIFTRTDTAAIMAELEERFIDECDYRKEADYQEAYRERFRGHRWIVVPRVHREYSGRRVLVTTLEHGRTFYEWLGTNPSPEERERATKLFYRFYLGSFYLDGLFNCDPHPGNYLFREDGKIVFLDYGCSRRFPDERRRLWISLARAVFADEQDKMHDIALQVGFFQEDGDYDREAFRNLMRYLYKPYLQDAPFDFSLHRPEDTFRQMFTQNPNLFKLNMPADAVFLNRIGFGLVSLLAEIGSSLNCHRHASSYFQGIDPDWPDDPHGEERVQRARDGAREERSIGAARV